MHIKKQTTIKVFKHAAVFLCAFIIIAFSFLPIVSFAKSGGYIPPKANALIPQFVAAANTVMPDFNKPHFFAAQGEHESCVSLKSSRCMDPRAELKTAREQGVGISQLTRTFRPDGTTRFDTVANLRQAYPKYLKDLNWDNIKERPDLQITAQVLLFNENYQSFKMVKSDYDRIAMAAAGYNGGSRDVHKSRYLCGLSKNCNPGLWFDNTEKYCVKSKKILYGNRSACDINIHYPKDVLVNRVPKYHQRFKDLGYEIKDINS